MTKTTDKKVTFIQSAAPTMKAGEYTLNVTQDVTATGDNPGSGSFAAEEKVFAVKGERFSFEPSELYGVFPPKLANGEYGGVLPQVVFNTLTLPWERPIESPNADPPLNTDKAEHTPWLAVLSFNGDEVPKVQKCTAKDLVKTGSDITVWGSNVTGSGALPANYLSYPGFTKLDYSESPDDPCTVIDIPIATFKKIAPSVEELYYLGHIREVDTLDSEDASHDDPLFYAVIVGNRLPQVNMSCHPFLVSLERMSDYLPASDGTPSTKIPADTTHVRLLTYINWQFTANDLAQSFSKLLENLNQKAGETCSSGLRIPSDSAAPEKSEVQTALGQQAGANTLTPANAAVLVQNALNQGYVPFNHHLRHGGQTVSWYRGPLAPYHANSNLSIPISCPDAANRYNPQTGLFDVSHGAAWQLGQLLALQNKRFAGMVYNWKKDIANSQVQAREAALLAKKMQGVSALASFLKNSEDKRPGTPPPIPDYIVYWLSRLRLLCGVPFNYLVSNEQMLPPESIRFFYLDMSWVDTLVDGALSIGRSTTAENLGQAEAEQVNAANLSARKAMKSARKQPAPLASTHVNTDEVVMGFLLRSSVVANWPRLNVNGYSNPSGDPQYEIPKLRMERVGSDVLICLFDGDAKMVAVHEVPEALHCGVEPAAVEDKCTPGAHVTTLRAVTGKTPGKQFLENPVPGHTPNACVPVRKTDDAQTLQVVAAAANIMPRLNADNACVPVRKTDDAQTLQVAAAVANIMAKLNADFRQNITAENFTSAEFALEMIKGVSKVEFFNPPPQENKQWQKHCPGITQSYLNLIKK